MAQSRERIGYARAAAASRRRVCRVYFDLYGVHTRRHNWLSISAVEHEVLAAELEHVRVCPAITDSLETIMRGVSAIAIAPGAITVVDVIRICIEHAESALRRFPFLSIRV